MMWVVCCVVCCVKMSCGDASSSPLLSVCRMYVVRDASRDKPFELEMGWLCEETAWKYTAVPADLV